MVFGLVSRGIERTIQEYIPARTNSQAKNFTQSRPCKLSLDDIRTYLGTLVWSVLFGMTLGTYIGMVGTGRIFDRQIIT